MSKRVMTHTCDLPTVTITCPIRDREWILPYYLNHIYNLDYPKNLIDLLWVVNQSSDNSELLLRTFEETYKDKYHAIKIINHFGPKKMPKDERSARIRSQHTYTHLSELRNFIFRHCKKTDYVLSCDCDILLRSDAIHKLLSHNKDICAGVIWNGYLKSPEKPWLYPNILRKTKDGFEHISNNYVKKSPLLSESKLGEIQATGAFVLLSHHVVKNTSYGWHPQGEDLYWSLDCEHRGFKMYVDYSVFGQHIMSPEYLKNQSTNGDG